MGVKFQAHDAYRKSDTYYAMQNSKDLASVTLLYPLLEFIRTECVHVMEIALDFHAFVRLWLYNNDCICITYDYFQSLIITCQSIITTQSALCCDGGGSSLFLALVMLSLIMHTLNILFAHILLKPS